MAKIIFTAAALLALLEKGKPEDALAIIEKFLTDANAEALKERTDTAKKEIDRITGLLNAANLKLQTAPSDATITNLTLERDNALSTVKELSEQIAAQAEVKNESQILVKVGKENYLLDKADMHTRDGLVTAADAAKDEKFLQQLIDSGAGNIRKAEK